MARLIHQVPGLAAAALLATASTLPALALRSGSTPSTSSDPHTLLARGGGGGRGGGGRGGGARTGFSGGGSFTRGDRQPSGGFSGGDRLNRVGNPSIRQPVSRPAGVSRPADRRAELGDRPLNRDWNRQVTIGDINLHPGWARPGWGVARPWNWGWYGGWSRPPWGWWGARAAAWGIGTLATAAVVNAAVNEAVANDATTILVPNSAYLLQFGTVQPAGNSSVSFVVTADGNSWQLTADCNAGTLNNREPNSSQEAELLNAACQVAYGDAS